MTSPPVQLDRLSGPALGPTLVVGAALGTSAGSLWGDVVVELRDELSILAWQLPGHGSAAHASNPFTLSELALAVGAAVERAAEEPVIIAGVSLGGAVGLELAARRPDLVRGVVTLGSGARLGDPALWRDRAAVVRASSTAAVVDLSARRWFAPSASAQSAPRRAALLRELRDVHTESYALACEALAEWDARDRLASIRNPVLALWGEHDVVAPEASSRELASGVEQGESAMLPGVAHLAPAEAPMVVAKTLRDFARRLGRT